MIFSYLCGWLMQAFLLITKNHYIFAILLFMIANMIICYPVERWGKNKSKKYSDLKPEIGRIENSGGDVHQVEKELTELYDKHNISFWNVVAQPLSTLLGLFMLTGFFNAIMQPFKYILHLPKVDIALLAETFKTGNQTAILNILCGDMTLLPEVSLDAALKLGNYVEALNSPKFFNLATIPTIKNLLWLPLVAVGMRLVQIGLTFLYSYLKTKHIKISSLVMQGVFFFMFLTFAFTAPSILCVYWILGTVMGLIQQIYLLIKLAVDKKKRKVVQQI